MEALSNFVAGYQTAKLEQGIDEGGWMNFSFRQWLAVRYKDNYLEENHGTE